MHMTWRSEHGGDNAPCPGCGKQTELLTPMSWKTHPEDLDDEEVEIEPEVVAHWCRDCDRITLLCLNQKD